MSCTQVKCYISYNVSVNDSVISTDRGGVINAASGILCLSFVGRDTAYLFMISVRAIHSDNILLLLPLSNVMLKWLRLLAVSIEFGNS